MMIAETCALVRYLPSRDITSKEREHGYHVVGKAPGR